MLTMGDGKVAMGDGKVKSCVAKVKSCNDARARFGFVKHFIS